LAPFGYLGANFGKKDVTPSQLHLRQKSALLAVEKYYTPEEFEQLMADLRDGLISVRIYDDGIIVDRPRRR
jgi:hypothetical protein